MAIREQAEINGGMAALLNRNQAQRSKTLKLPPADMSPMLRLEFEQYFESEFVVKGLLQEGALQAIHVEKAQFQDSNIDSMLRNCFKENYGQVKSRFHYQYAHHCCVVSN